jgi:hypothetical protein
MPKVAKQILILHGPDAAKEAEALSQELRNHCLNSLTFKVAMKQMPLGGLAIQYHEKLVGESVIVLVILSPGFLKDNFLIRMAENAASERKFIPVFSGFPDTKPSIIFTAYSGFNLNDPDIHEHEMKRLIMFLVSRNL